MCNLPISQKIGDLLAEKRQGNDFPKEKQETLTKLIVEENSAFRQEQEDATLEAEIFRASEQSGC